MVDPKGSTDREEESAQLSAKSESVLFEPGPSFHESVGENILDLSSQGLNSSDT